MSGASTIGERIKAIRLRTGLGQDAFAKALGYSKRALVNWELGGAESPVALMAKLRRDYDVDPEWVILGEDTVPRSYFGPVDWDRLDRLRGDVDAVCRDFGLKLPDERSQALARVLYDGGADAGAANCKRLRGMLLALSLGDSRWADLRRNSWRSGRPRRGGSGPSDGTDRSCADSRRCARDCCWQVWRPVCWTTPLPSQLPAGSPQLSLARSC